MISAISTNYIYIVVIICTNCTYHTDIDLNMVRKSPHLELDTEGRVFRVRLPRDRKGIHVIQLNKPLTPEQSYYEVSLRKTGTLWLYIYSRTYQQGTLRGQDIL